MNINNKEKSNKCQRCQAEEITIICHTCHPFHNFCNHCDSIIHSMKLKTNHIREPYLNSIELQNCPSINPQNTQQIIPHGHISHRSLTPDRQYIRSSFMERKTDKYNLDTYNPSKPESNYSNNYINEMQRLNEKEKDALKYKIDSLQNYIEKLKTNFQNEIKNSEDKAAQYLNEKKILEEKMNQLTEVILKEKNMKISLLSQENEHLKEKAKILEEKIKDKNFELKKKLIAAEQAVGEKPILELLPFKLKTAANKVSEMVKTNDDNLKNIHEMHKKEIYDIYFDGKTKNDKLIQQVQNDYNTIEMLKNNNSNLQQLIQKLENNNHLLLQENKELKSKNISLVNNLKSSYNINENLKKNIERIKIENNNMKSDFDYFEETINGLKNEIALMNETYAKKDKDFNYLLSQSEKIRKEFSSNMFNNEELDLKNRELIKENEELKRALLSFQETINI